MAEFLQNDDWELLLDRIKDGKCTPFLGAGAGYPHLPLGGVIAEEWADEFRYPLRDRTDLPRVAQYVSIHKDAMWPKEEIKKKFERNTKKPDFSLSNEPHALLADLNLPVYMTTNYDDFMVQALAAKHRDPRQEYCRWN